MLGLHSNSDDAVAVKEAPVYAGACHRLFNTLTYRFSNRTGGARFMPISFSALRFWGLPMQIATLLVSLGWPTILPGQEKAPTGLLFFASYPERDNVAATTNPHIIGALHTIYWSNVEPREGQFEWADIDQRLARWTGAGKKIALRIMWSSSGNWPEPAAKRPTPQWVLDKGAVTVHSNSSKTDIPLIWDPIYRKYSTQFLQEVARKFDGDPNILFLDVTPGAETNPYR